MAVLLVLRTLICMGVAVLVWYLLTMTMGAFNCLGGLIVAVWGGGLASGVVASLFSLRQGILMSFTTGVMLAVLFMWVYFGPGGGAGVPLLREASPGWWPMWFPAACFAGAYGYLMFLAKRDS